MIIYLKMCLVRIICTIIFFGIHTEVVTTLNGSLTLKTTIPCTSIQAKISEQDSQTKNKIRKFFVKCSFCQSPYLRLSSKPSTKMVFLTPINEYHVINLSVLDI